MSKYNSENGYAQLVEAFNNTNNAKEETRRRLLDVELISEEVGDLSSAIEALSKQVEINNPLVKNNFPYAQVTEYLVQANNFSNKFNEFNRYREQNNFFEISKQQAAREAERSDHWKLWRDKLGRWVLGIFSAVLIYSALVAMSEWLGWLKIPVRDLVVGG